MNTIEKTKWQHDAAKVVAALAGASTLNNMPFTSNDVWATGLLPTPPNRRWLGPVMRRAAAEGRIVKVATGVLSEHGHGATNNALWLGQDV